MAAVPTARDGSNGNVPAVESALQDIAVPVLDPLEDGGGDEQTTAAGVDYGEQRARETASHLLGATELWLPPRGWCTRAVQLMCFLIAALVLMLAHVKREYEHEHHAVLNLELERLANVTASARAANSVRAMRKRHEMAMVAAHQRLVEANMTRAEIRQARKQLRAEHDRTNEAMVQLASARKTIRQNEADLQVLRRIIRQREGDLQGLRVEKARLEHVRARLHNRVEKARTASLGLMALLREAERDGDDSVARQSPPLPLSTTPACAPLLQPATHCGGAIAGTGLSAFANHLYRWKERAGQRGRRRVRIMVLGNSVARWHKFRTSVTFRREMQAAFPDLTFETVTGAVEGGFSPSHQLYCGRAQWKTADIVLVHFAELASGARYGAGRQLLQQLLAMQHLLVIVIKHCSLPQLEVLVDSARYSFIRDGELPYENNTREILRSVWFQRDKHHVEMRQSASGMERAVSYLRDEARFELADRALPLELNVTMLDSCILLRSQLRLPSQCVGLRDHGAAGQPSHGYSRAPQSTTRHIRAKFERLATRMFPFNPKARLGDPLHPTEEYSDLQGCAAAQVVLRSVISATVDGAVAVRNSSTAGATADAADATHGNHESGMPWCLRAGDPAFEGAVASNRGWAVKLGGAGGNKRWLHATALGAVIEFQAHLTSPRLAIEYYKHDTLPLGMVRASVLGRTVLLDGRCVAADRCPKGKGFYHRAVILDSISLAAAGKAARVRLEVVPRSDGLDGTAFSVASIVGEL